jgi:uncharacterized membrane protein (UPF0127 family)
METTVREARAWRARLLGLAWLRSPPAGVALLLRRCRSVHTFGMRWALDLVWLDAAGGVVRVDRGVAPRRLRTCLAAESVIEVPAGGADAVIAALERPARDRHGPTLGQLAPAPPSRAPPWRRARVSS